MRDLALFLSLYMILSCVQDQEIIRQKYLIKGQEVASLTQSELLKNVSNALEKGGPQYAIEFCSINALFLKDSLSQLYNCQIKRIAHKYRNPIDMPQTEKEIEQLNLYQEDFLNGKSLKPHVFIFEKHIEYYQPIFVAKEACLKCHGAPDKDISNETLAKIRERYPNDLATGFALNDFRGAWKITFTNK